LSFTLKKKKQRSKSIKGKTLVISVTKGLVSARRLNNGMNNAPYTLKDVTQALLGASIFAAPISLYRAGNPYYLPNIPAILLVNLVTILILASSYVGINMKYGKVHYFMDVSIAFLLSVSFAWAFGIMQLSELWELTFLRNGLLIGMFWVAVPMAIVFDIRNIFSILSTKFTGGK
jgi:hypothetical protein